MIQSNVSALIETLIIDCLGQEGHGRGKKLGGPRHFLNKTKDWALVQERKLSVF